MSGSGKSTLVHDVLYRALEQSFGDGETTAKQHLGELVGAFDDLRGTDHLDGVVLVDQSPIGRTSRSNPVTYIKAWSEVRRIFSEQPMALEQGYGPGHFSFNVTGGRCEVCKGAGHIEIEMIFMADVSVPCEACLGKRFKPEILRVKYREKDLADVLAMTVDEAIRFFLREDKLGKALWQLQQVGLGYLRLGQPAPTLSGGEAQRLKIARELVQASSKGRPLARGRRTRRNQRGKLYILDEPTTGLSGEDVRRLLSVFDRLLDAGNTLVVIEHNLDVIAAADWLIDLGPGAGDDGGTVVAMGPPDEVAAAEGSTTGPYLQPFVGALRAVTPLASVLLPFKDVEAWIEEAVASIQAQSWGDFEVLAVDDASSDGSRRIVEQWADRDPRVRVLETSEPSGRGIVCALELARAKARGSVLIRMDGDDVAPPSRFAAQIGLLDQRPDLAGCSTPVERIPREALTDGGKAYERWLNALVEPDSDPSGPVHRVSHRSSDHGPSIRGPGRRGGVPGRAVPRRL